MSDRIKIEKFEHEEMIVTLYGEFTLHELRSLLKTAEDLEADSKIIKATHRIN